MLKTGLKKGLTHVGRRALTASANALADISENNTSIKDAFKKQAKLELAALNPINRIRDSLISNSPVKTRKRAASEKRSTTKKKREKSKVFKINLIASMTLINMRQIVPYRLQCCLREEHDKMI